MSQTSEGVKLYALGGPRDRERVMIDATVQSGERVVLNDHLRGGPPHVYAREGDLLLAVGEWAGAGDPTL